MVVGGAGIDAVEFDPGTGAGDLSVDFEVGFVLGMDPDEVRKRALGFGENFELLEGGGAVSGMRGERESGFSTRDGGGFDEFAAEGWQGAAVDSDFDEARFDAVDEAVFGFFDEAAGELVGRFGVGVGGEEDEIAGGVETGVGPDFEAGGVGETAEEAGVSAEKVGRAFEEAAAAEGVDFVEFGEGEAVDFVGIVAGGVDFVGTDEVNEDVFVDQGGTGERGEEGG